MGAGGPIPKSGMMRWTLALGLAGCLDPQVGDAIDPSRVFGNPNLLPGQLPHVEDNPELASRVMQFPTQVPYIKGFASDRALWYWRVPPPNDDFIVPLYVILDRDGVPIDRPIIDVLPGDAGYSPWWRVVMLTVTEAYAGERIYSREAVDLAVRLGLLEDPVVTDTVVTCPVVRSDVRVQVHPDGTSVVPTYAIYRNQRVSWVEFKSNISVPSTNRRMPLRPFFTFQRIDQAFRLSELDSGFDLDGDGQLNASNNIFEFDIGETGYTPLWYPILVRTVPDFVSIDTASTAADLEFTDDDDFVGPVYNVVTSPRVIPPIVEMRDRLDTCPIQRTFGEL
jgi:hypothetical protein